MRVITDQQVAAVLGYADVGQRLAQAFEALQQGRAAMTMSARAERQAAASRRMVSFSRA